MKMPAGVRLLCDYCAETLGENAYAAQGYPYRCCSERCLIAAIREGA